MNRVLVLFAALMIGCTGVIGAPHHRTPHNRASHGGATQEPAITADSVNAAAPTGDLNNPSLIIKAQVLLDRQHFSPGQIDGTNSDDFRKALSGFQQANGLSAT